MKKNRISMNVIMVIVIFVSVVTFFITIKMTHTASMLFGVNTYNPIEDSEYFIKYSNIEPNGVYKGTETVNELVLEGDYGYGDGAAVDNGAIYTSEYELTSMGVKLCKVVKINLETREKTTVINDAELRGRCASGELVISEGAAAKSNNADTNLLCKLYAISGKVNFDKKPVISFYDTEKSQVVFTTEDKTVNEKLFKSVYLDRTLSEVQK
ncbi:MAG: hypothetical protein K5755_05985 [Clostridiales bacterium]|nr:hypothetical protein [Clostridiales bacterium]